MADIKTITKNTDDYLDFSGKWYDETTRDAKNSTLQNTNLNYKMLMNQFLKEMVFLAVQKIC